MAVRLATSVLLAAGVLAGTGAAAQDALEAIDACRARLDPDTDVGYGRIAARCPDLAPALAASGWSAWLPASWNESNNDLSAGSLLELRTVVARELAVERTGPAPRVERLQHVLVELGGSAREETGLWGRFKSWLRNVLERSDTANEPGWFARMIGRVGLSQTVIELITYLAIAAVLALAALIVANELRLAAATRRRRTSRSRAGSAAAAAGGEPPHWRDVEGAPPADRPRLLLELVVDRLTRARRLPPAGSFTVRELARAARMEDETDRARLLELSLTAERLRYAGEALPPAALEAAIAQGRELLRRLEGWGEVAAP